MAFFARDRPEPGSGQASARLAGPWFAGTRRQGRCRYAGLARSGAGLAGLRFLIRARNRLNAAVPGGGPVRPAEPGHQPGHQGGQEHLAGHGLQHGDGPARVRGRREIPVAQRRQRGEAEVLERLGVVRAVREELAFEAEHREVHGREDQPDHQVGTHRAVDALLGDLRLGQHLPHDVEHRQQQDQGRPQAGQGRGGAVVVDQPQDGRGRRAEQQDDREDLAGPAAEPAAAQRDQHHGQEQDHLYGADYVGLAERGQQVGDDQDHQQAAVAGPGPLARMEQPELGPRVRHARQPRVTRAAFRLTPTGWRVPRGCARTSEAGIPANVRRATPHT